LNPGSAGGFAVPITLDPTLIPTSNGVVNPMRRIARIETIVGLEYRGLTSGAVVASYAPEGTEASDNSPNLGQPDLFVERAQTFIPYSIEIGMDWTGLQANLARLIADAKDVLEGNKFTLGVGHSSNEPAGVLTGSTTTITTAGSAAFAIADLYNLEEALPPRFRPLGQFLGNRHIYNLIRQFGQNANQNLWMPIVDPSGGPLSHGLANTGPRGNGNLGQRLLGYPTNEVSDMVTTLSTGSKILVLGDPNYYLIVDRIGMQVEFVPHLFGSNRRPTGQRGLYAYWRNTAAVVDPAGWRVLVTS
jgi:HK97 family phage major capsid protein